MMHCPHCERRLAADPPDSETATSRCPHCGLPLETAAPDLGELELEPPCERAQTVQQHLDRTLDRARREAAAAEPSSPPPPPDSPFRRGVWQFPWYWDTLPRWLALSAGAALCSLLLTASIAHVGTDAMASVLGVILLALFCVVGGLWFVAAAASCLAVLEQTACGNDRLTEWPDYQLTEHLGSALTLGVATAAAATPGWVLLAPFGLPRSYAAVAAVLTAVGLLPPVLLSMLETGSVAQLLSRRLLGTIRRQAETWRQFYLHYLLAICGTALLYWLTTLALRHLAAAWAVAGMLIVFRLLGRLAQILEAVTPQEIDELEEH